MKYVKITLAVIALLAASSVLAFIFVRANHQTQYTEERNFEGLDEKVEVYYDAFAIPHIYATSNKDAYFVLGYVHAKERLWQMELLRRIAPGRLSELFGPTSLETDRFFKSLDLESYGKKSAERFAAEGDPVIRELVMQYIEGINAFIEQGPTPIEYRILGVEKSKFELSDIYHIGDYMAFSFAMAHKTEPLISEMYARLGQPYLQDLDIDIDSSSVIIQSHHSELKDELISINVQHILGDLPAPALIGSNSWVIGPAKTTTGKVILANDPHIGYAQPAVWFEAHIETPEISLYGNYVGGYPFPHVGHTDRHAIGLTMFENDDIDLFRETVKDDDPERYLYRDEWLPFETSTSIIRVKGGDNDTLRLRKTVHGPVITPYTNTIDEQATISMWWSYQKFPNDLLRASYTMMNATSLEMARLGASLIHAPGLNVMYGDIDGNIAWWAAARLPKRPGHVNSKLILDGSSGIDDVTGYHPFEENPQAENPPWGYVYSANNQSIGLDSTLHPGYYLPEDRARRIKKLLDGSSAWDVAKVKSMLLDVTSENAPEIVSNILQALKDRDLNGEQRKWLTYLESWDGSFNSDAFEAVIYTKLLYHILYLGMSDELGEKKFNQFNGTHVMKRSMQRLTEHPESVWWDRSDTPAKENFGDIALMSLEKSMLELTQQLGSQVTGWKWSDVHILEHPHALGANKTLRTYFNVGPFNTEGTTEVINNLQFKLSGDGIYEAYAGPSCRRIVDFEDVRNNSWSILPTGQSGNVFSPHYNDQAEMYARGEYRKKLMNREVIIDEAVYKSTFSPVQ